MTLLLETCVSVAHSQAKQDLSVFGWTVPVTDPGYILEILRSMYGPDVPDQIYREGLEDLCNLFKKHINECRQSNQDMPLFADDFCLHFVFVWCRDHPNEVSDEFLQDILLDEFDKYHSCLVKHVNQLCQQQVRTVNDETRRVCN